MNEFLQRHQDKIIGVLKGFDRLRFRGTLRRIVSAEGLSSYLCHIGVLLKDFAKWSQSITAQVREVVEELPAYAERPNLYLQSSADSKEELARKIAHQDGIKSGPICTLRCVEPCWSFEIHRNREQKKLELQPRFRKCIHVYHYQFHPLFGFMHVRLQTWFPFTVTICINGREWLSHQLDAAGIPYVKRENSFPALGDVARAQKLFDQQLTLNWPHALHRLIAPLNPALPKLFRKCPLDYYWSLDQSEWATDIMFKSPKELAALYPRLIHHAMTTFGSEDVMRFLGRKVPASGIHSRFSGEVVSALNRRLEGIRIKHRLNLNSIKMYDKGSLLRIEATINRPDEFKVFRTPEGQPKAKQRWMPMRKGVADIHRRAQVSNRANEAYLEALACADSSKQLQQLLDTVCKPTCWKGSRVRALKPFHSDDTTLLQAISRGEFTVNGFCNRDLRQVLFPAANSDPAATRKRSSFITRKIRMLRAHGLIQKIQKSYRYRVTKRGQELIAALTAAADANTEQLLKLAA